MTQVISTQTATGPLRLHETDAQMPRHWRSGSLKYSGFSPLAQGGVASVQTCTDQNLGRDVAYKTLHPHLAEDDVETRRFLREARVTAMIPHPGTVPVYELGRDRQGALFFTMKRIEGRDLRAILADLASHDPDTQDQFPLPRLIDILIQACNTVAFAHSRGVIHRDLKPANLQVGSFGEVMVLDWGLAKILDEPDLGPDDLPSIHPASEDPLTCPGTRCGTPLYMSPEQARGDDELDERTDVYNLGIILFEMLTCQPLVKGKSIDQVLELIRDQPTPQPSSVTRRWVPAELEAVCLKALAKDPADRYASVLAMAEDLIAYRSGQRVCVYTYNPIQKLMRWRKRHLVPISVLTGLAIGALATTLFNVIT